MAKFKYVAINSKGKTLPGEIAASDAKEARQKIRQKGLTPLQIKSLSGGDSEQAPRKQKKPVKSKKKISAESKKGVRGKGEKVGLEF